MGSFVDKAIFYPQAEDGVRSVSVGSMHMYMLGLRNLADKRAALADANVRSLQTPRDAVDLYVNPLPHGSGTGGFNPFQIREVRQALNWLIDRDMLVRELYGGFAIPYISPWHPGMPEYSREAAFFHSLDQEYGFDPSRAKSAIFDALFNVPELSFQSDGKWYYQGRPLTIRFVIRIEDQRLEIGDYVADRLEGLGIDVIRDYRPAAEAFGMVYFGPPDIGAWHLYTEALTLGTLVAWQDDWLASIYDVPCDFWCPPWPTPPALIDVANSLLNGRYANLDERQDLIRRGSELAMQHSLRVWILVEDSVFVTSKAVESYVWDSKQGPWSVLSVRSARFASPGGMLRIGQPVHWQSPWNPVRGFESPYDAIEQRAFSDPGLINHPHTGAPMPFRAQYGVSTAGPAGTMPIPAGAVIWNTTASMFQAVPGGATAYSKVTYDHAFGSWHDGSPMSMDDVWYTIAHFHRRAGGSDRAWNPYAGTHYPTGDLGAIDPRADSPAVNFWLGVFKGARQIDSDSIEVYADYWHIDPGMIALTLDIFPSVPWQAHELMAKTVLDNETRYDPLSAARANKVLVDLSKGASIPLLDSDVAGLRAANFVPAGFGGFITSAEAADRWSALESFRATRGHFYVSNGPFVIETISETAQEVTLKRFSAYPFAPPSAATFTPRLPVVSIGPIPEIVPNRAASIPVTATVGGELSDLVVLDYEIRSIGMDQLRLAGEAAKTGPGAWEVKLDANQTGSLTFGTYDVVVIAVGAEAGGPVIARESFAIHPESFYIELLLNEFRAKLKRYLDGVKALDGTISATRGDLGTLTALASVAVGLAILAVVLGVLSLTLVATREGARPPSRTWRSAWRRYGSRK